MSRIYLRQRKLSLDKYVPARIKYEQVRNMATDKAGALHERSSWPGITDNNYSTRLRPGQFVDDKFRVSGIAKRGRNRGRDHFFLITLADDTGGFDAIVGEASGQLALGQTVHVRGCVLVRRSEPILVGVRNSLALEKLP